MSETGQEHGLTVEYALTRSEIFGSFLRSVAGSPKYRNTILSYSAAIGVFTALIRATSSRSLTPEAAISGSAATVGFLLFIPVWVCIRGKTAKRTLTVNSDGITTKIGRVGDRYPWKKVQQVTDTPQFVLMAMTNGNAFFMPIRAFSGPEHREKFLTETRNWSGATSTNFHS